jgi:RNA polymerase-binding transcription factor DksA
MTIKKEIMLELKEKLQIEKEKIQSELERIGKKTTEAGDYDTNFNEIGTGEDENASEVEEYTDNLSVEANLEKQLKEINEALEKIETSNYGKCENCDAEIPEDRLRAYPAAKTCMNC